MLLELGLILFAGAEVFIITTYLPLIDELKIRSHVHSQSTVTIVFQY